MPIPLRVSFRGMEPDDALEATIRSRVSRLERYDKAILECAVVVEVPHRRRRQGKLYRVRISLKVPGEQLVGASDPARPGAHEDPLVALRDAHKSARRELMDYARRQRGQVKARVGPSRGRVVRLFPEDGYGFIERDDGMEIYFHSHSVVSGYDDLEVGSPVRFAEEAGEKGPQASSVSAIGRRRRRAARGAG